MPGNFGDELGPLLVTLLTGRAVEWAAPGDCDLAAVGSILAQVSREAGRAGRQAPLPVWGSGLIGPDPAPLHPSLVPLALRGALTRDLLGLPPLPLGDPGILAPALVPRGPLRRRWGIVPHFSQRNLPLVRDLAARPGCTLIDPTAPPLDVLARIASCEAILSSSLHGLIVADGYGIPCRWLDLPSHDAHRFKFDDYRSGVGRPPFDEIGPEAAGQGGGTGDPPAPFALPQDAGATLAAVLTAAL